MSQPIRSNGQEIDPGYKKQCEMIYDKWQNSTLSFRQAIEQLSALERHASLQQHSANQGLAMALMGMIFGYRSDYDMSIRYFTRARDSYQRARNARLVTLISMNLAESYRMKGDYADAWQHFHFAYESASRHGYTGIQAYSALHMGHMLMTAGPMEGAKEYFMRAIEHGKQVDDVASGLEVQCSAREGLATFSLKRSDIRAAWENAVEAMRLARELDNSFHLGLAYRTMGDVMTMRKVLNLATTTGVYKVVSAADVAKPVDNDETQPSREIRSDPDKFYRLAIDFFGEHNADAEVAKTIYLQGESLLKRNNKIEAASAFQQAARLFTMLDMRDDANLATLAFNRTQSS